MGKREREIQVPSHGTGKSWQEKAKHNEYSQL